MLPAVWSRRWREHPMRRRVDVFEARVLLAVGAVVVVGAPCVGTVAGWSVYGHDRAVAAGQEAALRPVRAEVLADAPEPSPWADESSRPAALPVPARWTAVGGEEVKGTIRVPPGTVRGERKDIWLDREGRVAAAPLNDSDIWVGALTAGFGGGILTVTAGAFAAVLARDAFERRRTADWDTEWDQVEPRWSRRSA
ncbi:Rv1733c family protein [Streptomyces xantholiticus]